MKFFKVARSAAIEFIADRGMKLSAALAYYTIFSIGPVLVIIISLAGLFYGRDAAQGTIYYQINDFIGNSAALQVQEIIQNIEKSQLSASGAVVGFIVLLVGATGVFTEIQDSINYIWSIKAKPKRGFVKLLTDRLISFSLIIGFGFVMLVSLIINAVVDVLQKQLMRYFDTETVFLFQGVNYIVLFAVITMLFAIIFKVLPDATIRWRDALIGASFTAVLFLLGKFLIGFYLTHSSIGETYGAAASIIIVLLWVYYTSIILFFGAEFTKIYTLNYGGGIEPNKTAVFILKREAKELDYEKLEDEDEKGIKLKEKIQRKVKV